MSIKRLKLQFNNPASFDDSYESKAEDEIAREEVRTEKEKRSGKKEASIAEDFVKNVHNKHCIVFV
jgi:hypothetical protein